MNNTFKAALAAALMFGSAQVAHADLNLSGEVGLPLNPTAQIPEPGGVRLQANYYDGGDAGSGDGKFYGLYGAGRAGDKLEISGGIDRLDGQGGGIDKTGAAIGVKYLFTKESDPAGVRFAVGAGYDHALLKNYHVYGVATKYLGSVSGDKVPVVGHLGLRYDHWGSVIDDNKVSVFAGAEVPLSRTGEFQVVGEIQSKNVSGGKVPYSASLRYRPAGKPFGVSAGWQRQGVISDGGFFVQLGYTFGTGGSDTAAATTAK
jgi:hypothetical protein